MPKALKIVASPIGNIRDISLRAIDEIKHADVIFAEDTRHTLKLIEALGITLKPNCRLISCDSHKEVQRIDVVAERLLQNDNVLLLSDAGCPTISDPGSLLVQGLVERNLNVEIIPGPSAHSAALMGAGIDMTRFVFLGFLPQRKNLRRQLIKNASAGGFSLVIYESALRMTALLDELFSLLGSRRVVIARELTKLYETFHRGHLGGELTPHFVAKGECVVLIEGGSLVESETSEEEIIAFIKDALAEGGSRKDLVTVVAERFKLKKSAAYALVIKDV